MRTLSLLLLVLAVCAPSLNLSVPTDGSSCLKYFMNATSSTPETDCLKDAKLKGFYLYTTGGTVLGADRNNNLGLAWAKDVIATTPVKSGTGSSSGSDSSSASDSSSSSDSTTTTSDSNTPMFNPISFSLNSDGQFMTNSKCLTIANGGLATGNCGKLLTNVINGDQSFRMQSTADKTFVGSDMKTGELGVRFFAAMPPTDTTISNE